MKIKIFPIALLAVLSATAVSCQKENVMDNAIETIDSKAYTMQYAINGVTHSALIHNEAEAQALLQYLLALTREGYETSIYNESTYSPSASKETITYTTKSEDDAVAWGLKKAEEGYKVSHVYNPKTGEYTCIATR